MNKIALVTGATQGLGLALVERLSARLDEQDVVYLTGRDQARMETAAQALAPGRATVLTELLDVSSSGSVAAVANAIAERHGAIDMVFSNAYSRVLPQDDPASVVGRYVEVNNLGTTRVLRAFAPLLRPGGRLLVVASTMGTLHYLAPVLHERFDELASLDDVDAAVCRWRDAVLDESAFAQAWPAFVNIPSKVAQVAAVRTLARARRAQDAADGTLIAAVCPGMIDTATSRPWFDTSAAQTPSQAAEPLLDLVLEPVPTGALYGELVRFGQVLPWSP
jgi:NAD(P)-dependent dehydrogenase (short-subunit alcohol dehydrogenase family)